MARAPSNPQRNIERQELQELQEFRSCRIERPLQVRPRGCIRKDSEFISFKSMTQSQALPFCNS